MLEMENHDGSNMVRQRIIELKKELLKLEALLEGEGDQELEMLYSYIANSIYRYTKHHIQPFYILRTKNRKLFNELKDVMDMLLEFAQENNLSEKKELFILFQLYSDLICEYLQEIGVPIHLKTVVQSSEQFPGLLNKAYPGYLKSGLLKFLIQAKLSKE